jgi:hypothetical protein
MYLRYANSCGKDDYEFGLSGSQSAINYVVDSYYMDRMNEILESMREEKRRDSILKVVRQERLEREEEEARLEAIRKSQEIEQNRIEFVKAIPDMFRNSAAENYEHKIIATIVVTHKVRFNYCKKIFDSGVEVFDKEIIFFQNQKFNIYNDVDGECIKFVQLSKNNEELSAIYLPITEIGLLADDYHLNVISENWPEIKAIVSTRKN